MTLAWAFLAWFLALGLGLSRAPWWVLPTVPLALAVFVVVWYLGELHPATGDGQANLVALVGAVTVLVCAGMAALGRVLRTR
ncbi:MAG TPA: hypothetical protein VF533_05125 [Solirubrobacteraceae bacterium]|jgi:hypothetical protein